MDQILLDSMLTLQNALILGGVFGLLQMLKKLTPKMTKSGWYNRVLPVLPELLCSGAVFLPGMHPEGQAWTVSLFVGLVLGAMSSKVHKVMRQSFLGDDSDIQEAKKAKLSKEDPK
jgi:hypothetical protein